LNSKINKLNTIILKKEKF